MMKIFLKKHWKKLAVIFVIGLLGTYIWFVVPAEIFPSGGIPKGDWLAFWGGFLSFIGTIILGIVAIWQNENAHELNRKLFETEAIKSRAYISVYPYKAFSDYNQYESYLSDNVLAFYTDTSKRAAKQSTPSTNYGDGRIKCIEFCLLGEMPALEARIETKIIYHQNRELLKDIKEKDINRYNSIMKHFNGKEEVVKVRLETVCVPIFSNATKYLQLIPFEHYYIGCIDTININYRTLDNERIKYIYKLLNFREIADDNSAQLLVSEKYFTSRNDKEEPLFDEIKYSPCRFQTNRRSIHAKGNEQ